MAGSQKWYKLPDNYIYISHLSDLDDRYQGYYILPNYPDSIQDTMSVDFQSATALARTAPVYTYSQSGPRTMQITLDLHRDLMDNVNQGVSNITPELGDDYLDTLLKALQSIALPRYNLNNKAVEPPMVAIRICDEIFIKGIVTGAVSVTYQKPILSNGRYAHVTVAFNVYEVDPYDATTVYKNGGFRGLTRGMKKGFKLETGD